jgi:hypothetical protein
MTDAGLLARATVWAATDPQCRQPGLQHRQWRPVPLERDVAAAGPLLRPGGGSTSLPMSLVVVMADKAAAVVGDEAAKHGTGDRSRTRPCRRGASPISVFGFEL